MSEPLEAFPRKFLTMAVAQTIKDVAPECNSIERSGLEILVDIAERCKNLATPVEHSKTSHLNFAVLLICPDFTRIASRSKYYAELTGRTDPNVFDVEMALQEHHVPSITSLKQHLVYLNTQDAKSLIFAFRSQHTAHSTAQH
jgi:hypothetical protein